MKRTILKRAAWAALLCATAAFAQMPSGVAGAPDRQITQRHNLSGTVVNAATGEPVRKALISIQSGEGAYSAFSDVSGNFTLEGVPDSQYGLACAKPGFAQQAEQVAVSVAMQPVVLKLVPYASVTGRVADDNGKPIEGISVSATQTLIVDGRKTWNSSWGGTTDEDGAYTIEDLPPGTYRVQTGVRVDPESAVGTAQISARSAPRRLYPATFFGGATNATAAQTIELKPGETQRADIEVRSVPGYRVEGTVLPVGVLAMVSVQDPEGNAIADVSPANPLTGHFVLPAVPPGSWQLSAQAGFSGSALWGEQPVSVRNGSRPNVQIQLQPLPVIPVHISQQRAEPQPNLQVRLIPDHASMMRGDLYASPGQSDAAGASNPPNDSLQFTNVFPGHYRLSVHISSAPSGEPSCLESARAGSEDVLREGLTVSSGTASPITITLGTDCATLQPRLSTGAMVVLVPNDPGGEVETLNVQATGNEQQGRFRDLRPGTYRLYALRWVEGLEFRNPEALRQFPAQEVTLTPGQHAEVSLDAIAGTPP